MNKIFIEFKTKILDWKAFIFDKIILLINTIIYRFDRFFVFKSQQIKQYFKYIPFGIALLILLCVVYFEKELFLVLTTEEAFKALGTLALSLGSALVGVTAIVFTLVIFSLQVNIEKLPYGLFHSFSFDKKLMLMFGAIFTLAVTIASLSLWQSKLDAVIIFLFIMEALTFIIFLLYSTYQRALMLINPHEQLRLLEIRVDKSLQWWDRRFERAKALIPNSNESDNFNWKKDSFFQINPHYFNEVKTALNYIDAIVQRHFKAGDYIVSKMALYRLVTVSELYIKAKDKTFFSYSPFLDTGLWDDPVINKTLEYLRVNFSINMKKNDERALNQILYCYVQLAKVYTQIEYRIETGAKVHANLASKYLIDNSQKLIQSNYPDLLMNAIRSLEDLVVWYIENGLLRDSVSMIECIGRLGASAALKQDQKPVTQAAMNSYGSIVQRILVSKNDISFVLKALTDQIRLLVSLMLKQPDLYNHYSLLGTYYSFNDTSLLHFLTDLTNVLLDQETLDKESHKLLNNLAVFADKSYSLNKDLFLLALENRSMLFHNILVWIDQFAYLLMMLSTINGSKKEFEKFAHWYLSIISWIPEESTSTRHAAAYSLTETLFEAGEKYIEQGLTTGTSTIIDLLINWSFKLGKYDEQHTYQFVLGILGVSHLTLKCKCEFTPDKLIKQTKDNLKKYPLSNETCTYVCERLDTVISGAINEYGTHTQIEKVVMESASESMYNLIREIKTLFNFHNQDT